MRCSVVSIVPSQQAINQLISRWAVRNTPLSTCSSNPMSSRSSMVSSNWYCNLMAKSLTRWTKRSCCSRIRTWSAVALRAALCMDKVRNAVQHWWTSCCNFWIQAYDTGDRASRHSSSWSCCQETMHPLAGLPVGAKLVRFQHIHGKGVSGCLENCCLWGV